MTAIAEATLSPDERPERDAIVRVAREIVAAERARLAGDGLAQSADALAASVVSRLRSLARPRVATTINATGVIVHTNLGRAPWPRAAIEAAAAAAGRPLLLELDAATGRRGRRYREAEDHLIAITGADDALVVNNNAAAVALAVGLAGRGGVAVSRGELVEIGGGVRIPEIVRRAGARLIEVGTTNRTRVEDFAEPLQAGRARVVLRVHLSNFRQSGFVESPGRRELAELAHRHGAWVVDDLGSGALLDTTAFGLGHEPTPTEALEDGADVVTFSGDKLVGGPQAGLIVGKGELIARLRRDPLNRAMRPDKTTLVALASTLALYRAGRALDEIPVWRAIATSVEELRRRAERILAASIAGDRARIGPPGAAPSVVDLEATVGGGSLPTETLPSAGLRLPAPGRSADELLRRLRTGEPSVVGRVESGAVVLDLRTVDPADDAALAAAIRGAPAAGPVADRR